MAAKNYKHLVQEYKSTMEKLGEDVCFEDAWSVSIGIMRQNTYGERVIKRFWREFDKLWHEDEPSDLR